MNRVFTLAFVLISVTAAHADDKTAAEAYFRAGAKAYAAQNFGAAAENFDEAYKAAPLPEIAFSAAQAYRRWSKIDPKPEHVKRSVALYRAYLAVVKTGGRVGDAADNLQEMERELDKLKLSTTSSTPEALRTRIGVSITFADQRTDTDTLREIGDVSAAQDGANNVVANNVVATIDGTPVEPFALINVDAKEHVITVAADGYLPIRKSKVAVTGLSSLVEVELQPKPAVVKLETESGAQVAVDGRAVATTPAPPLQLPSGRHLISVLRRGREPFGTELVLGRGQQVTLAAPLVRTARRRAVPYVLAGAGGLAVGAIATGIFAIVHDRKASDIRDDLAAGNRAPSDGDRYDDQVRSRDRVVTATWALGGAALAAGTVGVLLYLFDKPSTEGLRFAPTMSPGQGGVTVVGAF